MRGVADDIANGSKTKSQSSRVSAPTPPTATPVQGRSRASSLASADGDLISDMLARAGAGEVDKSAITDSAIVDGGIVHQTTTASTVPSEK